MDVDVLCCQEAANEEMSLTSELEEVWIPMEMCWIKLNHIFCWVNHERHQDLYGLNMFELWIGYEPPFQVLVQLSSHLFSPGGLQSPGAAQRWWRNRKTRDFREAKKVSGTANSDKFWIHLVAGPHWWPENPLDEFLVIDEFPSSGPPRSGVFELRLMTRVSERSNIRGGEPLKDSSGGQDGEREREMGQFVPGTQGLMKDIN